MKTWIDELNDKQLRALEKRLAKLYRDGYKELEEMAEQYFNQFKEDEAKKQKELDDGKITEEDFKKWKKQAMMDSDRWEDLKAQMADRIVNSDKIASQYINNETPKAYVNNFNYTQYEGEMQVGVSFSITNEQAVKNAIMENHVNFKPAGIKENEDFTWAKTKLQNELAIGIMQGKTSDELAKSFQRVMGSSYKLAVRNARTSYTSAQNSGRLDSFYEFLNNGIYVQKEWMSTRDGKTRDSHAELNGVRVDVDEPFPNGLMYPADPDGSPAEVYNCRCKLVSYFPGVSTDRKTGKSVDSYKKWLEFKESTVEEVDFKRLKRGLKRRVDFLTSKTVKYDDYSYDAKEYFEKGLKNADNRVVKALNKAKREAKYALIRTPTDAYSSGKIVAVGKDKKGDSIAHELFHTLDTKFGNSKKLANAIDMDYKMLIMMAGSEKDIIKYISKNYPYAVDENKLKLKYRRLSDIINAITDGEIILGGKHNKKYWNEKTKKAEIWAECGTIYYNNNQDEIVMLQELFPNIENEFIKRIQNVK